MAFDGSCLVRIGTHLTQLRLLLLGGRGLGLSQESLALIAISDAIPPLSEFWCFKGADVHLFLFAKASVNTTRYVLPILKAF